MNAGVSTTSVGRRYLALWFPTLPTDRLHHIPSSGAQPDEPLILVAKVRNALRITAACVRAQKLGMAVGLSLADARARLPAVCVLDADPLADAGLLERFADIAERWSPMVAIDPPDGLLIDVSGCVHLFGGEAGLALEADAVLGRYAQVRHAFAATPSAARALARFAGTQANEIDIIRQLPVAALRLDHVAEAALCRAGLKQIGDLADRPTAPLSARFGQAAVDALNRMLGRIDSRIVPRRPAPALHFARRFAEPVTHIDAIFAALKLLAIAAAGALEQRGEGGRRFAVRLYRSDGARRDLAIETGRPSRDPALMMRLFHERIEALADPIDPGFGFDLMHFAIAVTEPLAAHQPDLAGGDQRGEALAALIERLSIRHGRDRIRRFLPVDTHIPERVTRSVPALDLARSATWPAPPMGEPPLRPLCLLDPPEAIEVLAEVPDAPPRRFHWRGTSHIVTRAEGPERIAAPWWTKAGEGRPTRDYYRVEDSEGRRFWLFRRGLHEREIMHPRWYMHGLFA